jgi:hypothetical protein
MEPVEDVVQSRFSDSLAAWNALEAARQIEIPATRAYFGDERPVAARGHGGAARPQARVRFAALRPFEADAEGRGEFLPMSVNMTEVAAAAGRLICGGYSSSDQIATMSKCSWNTLPRIRVNPGGASADDPETFAVKQHILGELALPGEILPVGAPPVCEAAIAFALIACECCVDIAEASLRKLDGLDNRKRLPNPLSITISLPTAVKGPSLAAQHVAVFAPLSTSAASSSAMAGLSPNEKLSTAAPPGWRGDR